MQQPKMIVLALLGTGLRYGFEMEDFAQRTNMRQWAKIGLSTIYKALGDLEREGSITVTIEEGEKGPPRKAYALTRTGRLQMADLITAALASDLSIYSERIAGLVFAPLMGPGQAEAAIEASIQALEGKEAALVRTAKANDMDRIGGAVVEFHRAVYEAERKAMLSVLGEIRTMGPEWSVRRSAKHPSYKPKK